MAYTRHIWQDGEEGGTPIDAKTLNEVEAGISGNSSDVTAARAVADNATAVANDAAEDAAEALATANAASATANAANATAVLTSEHVDSVDANLTPRVASAEDDASAALSAATDALSNSQMATEDAADALAAAAAAETAAAAAETSAAAAAEDAAEALAATRGALPYQHLTLRGASVGRAQVTPGRLVHDSTLSTRKIMTPAVSNTTVTVEDGVYAITFHVAATAAIGYLSGATVPANGYMAIKNPAETKTVAMQRPHSLSYSWTMAVPCVFLGPSAGLEQIKFMYVGSQSLTGVDFDIHIVRLA